MCTKASKFDEYGGNSCLDNISCITEGKETSLDSKCVKYYSPPTGQVSQQLETNCKQENPNCFGIFEYSKTNGYINGSLEPEVPVNNISQLQSTNSTMAHNIVNGTDVRFDVVDNDICEDYSGFDAFPYISGTTSSNPNSTGYNSIHTRFGSDVQHNSAMFLRHNDSSNNSTTVVSADFCNDNNTNHMGNGCPRCLPGVVGHYGALPATQLLTDGCTTSEQDGCVSTQSGAFPRLILGQVNHHGGTRCLDAKMLPGHTFPCSRVGSNEGRTCLVASSVPSSPIPVPSLEGPIIGDPDWHPDDSTSEDDSTFSDHDTVPDDSVRSEGSISDLSEDMNFPAEPDAEPIAAPPDNPARFPILPVPCIPIYHLLDDWKKPFKHVTWKILRDLVAAIDGEHPDANDLISTWFYLPLLLTKQQKRAKFRQLVELSDQPVLTIMNAVAALAVSESVRRRNYTGAHRVIMPSDRKIRELLSTGQAGKAIQLISTFDEVMIADPTEVQEQLRTLFPVADPVIYRGQQPPSVIGQAELIEAIKQSPKGRANGLSGWTYDLLGYVFVARNAVLDDEDAHLPGLLTRFVNHIANDRLAESKDLLVASRIVPLMQRGSAKLRPIQVSDALCRIIQKTIAQQLKPRLEAIFAPLQYGVGVKGGAEIVAHATQLYSIAKKDDASVGVLQLDIKNAFNSISRQVIADRLAEEIPELATAFMSMCACPQLQIDAKGTVITTATQGVKQGDPLSPILFCLGLKPILSNLEASFPDHHFLAYEDDITVLGPVLQFNDIIEHTARTVTGSSMQVNRLKCISWQKNQNDGLVNLGTPVGTAEYRSAQAEVIIGEYLHNVDRITLYAPAIALYLLQIGYVSKPGYLARTTPTFEIKEALKSFDTKVQSVLNRIMGIQPAETPRVAQLIRGLPTHMGGRSLTRYEDTASSMYVASLAASIPALSRHRANLMLLFKDSLQLQQLLQHVSLVTPNAVSRDAHSNLLNIEVMAQVPSQAQLVKDIHARDQLEVHAYLDVTRAKSNEIAAFNYKGNTSILNLAAKTPTGMSKFISANQTRLMLRQQMTINEVVCPCNTPVPLNGSAYSCICPGCVASKHRIESQMYQVLAEELASRGGLVERNVVIGGPAVNIAYTKPNQGRRQVIMLFLVQPSRLAPAPLLVGLQNLHQRTVVHFRGLGEEVLPVFVCPSGLLHGQQALRQFLPGSEWVQSLRILALQAYA